MKTVFDPPLATPVPAASSSSSFPGGAPNGDAFVSFKTFLLVLDDGPEQGAIVNPCTRLPAVDSLRESLLLILKYIL